MHECFKKFFRTNFVRKNSFKKAIGSEDRKIIMGQTEKEL